MRVTESLAPALSLTLGPVTETGVATVTACLAMRTSFAPRSLTSYEPAVSSRTVHVRESPSVAVVQELASATLDLLLSPVWVRTTL